jgi:hypothetical protein
MGISAMSTKWNFSSTFLPYTGEPIDFQLEDREEPIHGTFANGTFHSRWADYDADRVQSWRTAIGDPAHEGIAGPSVENGRAWFAPWTGLVKRLLVRGDRVAPAPTPRRHARTAVRPAPTVTALSSTANSHRDSNQMSS